MVQNYTFEDVKNIVLLNKSRNATFLEYYKNYIQYVMDRQTELDAKGDEYSWMANVKSPITFFLSATLYGMYLTSKVNFDLTKRFPDEASEQLGEKMISMNQYWYDVNDTRDAMNRVALDAVLLGTGFGQVTYRNISDEIDESFLGKNKKGKKSYKIPSVEYINAMNFYNSLSASNVYSSPFSIVRKIKNKNTINNYYSEYGIKIDMEKVESGEILEEKDRDMVIKYMMFNNMPGVSGAGKYIKDGGNLLEQHYDIISDNSFKFGERDASTKKIKGSLVEIYELHTDDEITIFCNGVKYGAFKKKFPRKKKPFFSIKLKDSLNMLYGLGTGHLSYNLQKMLDMFLNLRMDISRLEATAPIAVDSGDSYFDGQHVFKPYPGKIVKLTNPEKGRKKIEYGYNPAVAGQEVEALTKMIQDSLGLSGYSLGVQQKVERVAKGVQELVESVDRSFANFVESYGQAMSFIQKYWTVMSIATVDEDFLNRVLGDGASDIKNVKISDVVYEFNFGFNLNPMRKAKDAIEVQQLISFMQTAGNLTRPDGTPLIDNEYIVDQLIEKMDMPLGTKLTKDEAMEYMRDQVKRNAELKTLESNSMPQPVSPEGVPMEQQGGIVPDFNTKKPIKATGAVSGTPGIQGGSIAGETQITNPEGVNQVDVL